MSEENTEVENTEVESTEPERDIVAEAKVLGWHDPNDDDYRGDKDKALSAEDFIKRGEEELPLIRANNKKLQKQINDLESGRDEFKTYMESQLKRQEVDYEKRLREAARDGDVEAYDQITKEKSDFIPLPTVESGIPQAVQDFQERNTWYGVDDKMTQYAQFIDNQIGLQNLNLTPEAHFKKVEAAVMEQYPKKSPRKVAPQAVEGGRRRPTGGTAKTYEAMPQADRTACDRMAKKWGIDKKSFVENYWTDQEKQS